MVDWRENEQRWVDRRSQYLKRSTPLDKTDARIIAWSELGYSSTGIAKQVDLGESTIQQHLDEIAENHGRQAVYAKPVSELGLSEPLRGDADV